MIEGKALLPFFFFNIMETEDILYSLYKAFHLPLKSCFTFGFSKTE